MPQEKDPQDKNVVYTTTPELVHKLVAEMAIAGFEVKKRREPSERVDLTPAERLEVQLVMMTASLRELGAVYIPTSNLFRWNGNDYTPDSMATRVYCAMDSKKGWSKDTAKAALEVYINNQRKILVEEARKQVMVYDASIGDVELKKFVGLMTGVTPADANPLHVAAVKSLVWQVKRKFAGHYRLERPLMVIFAGGQEFGKSWTMQEFFGPIKEWVGPPYRLKILNDRFSVDIFNKYYVLPFEDMHKDIANVELGLFKSLITEPTFPYRAPRDKFNLQLDNVATCYATTNFSTRELLPDDTGARRWWEIPCPNRAWTEQDKAVLDTIDFYRLWQSVDGSSSDNPRRELLEQFREIQSTKLRHTTPLEHFFQEEILFTDNESDTLTQAQLYEVVRAWFEEQGSKPPMKKAVKDIAARMGATITMPNNRPKFHKLKLRPQ